jgi:hypothetical protein
LPPADQQHGIAVDHPAQMIDENRTIAIAIEGHAHLRADGGDRFRQALRMRRPTVQVDVAPIRIVADDGDVEAEAAEQRRTHSRRRAVRTVDDHLHPGECRRVRQDGAEMMQVAAHQIGVRHGRWLTGPRIPRAVGDDRLDFALHTLGELFAPAREHLDAVVLERIV